MKVKFLPQDEEFEIKPNQSVMNLAHENGIHIQSVCKGLPSCAECRIKVVEGDTNVLPPFAEELDLIGTSFFVDQRRLSCQLRCFGDLVVDLTEQIEKENVSKKQPRGKAKKEGEETFARLGNILDERAETDKEIEIAKEELERAQKEAKASSKEGKSEAKSKDDKQGRDSRNRNRNRNRKKKTKNKSGATPEAKASNQKTGSGEGKKKKKKFRRRPLKKSEGGNNEERKD